MEQEASELMRGLSSSVDSEATIESLKGLMALIERADGATAEELAAALRRHGAVQRLCALVDDAAPSVHRRSMAILGNLVADVFDPRAVESVALASKAGVLPRLLTRLGDASFPAKLYAAACLQNMTSVDGDVCDFLNGQGGAKQLEAMLRQPGLEDEVCSRTPRCCPYPPPPHPSRTHLCGVRGAVRAADAVCIGHSGQHAGPRGRRARRRGRDAREPGGGRAAAPGAGRGGCGC